MVDAEIVPLALLRYRRQVRCAESIEGHSFEATDDGQFCQNCGLTVLDVRLHG